LLLLFINLFPIFLMITITSIFILQYINLFIYINYNNSKILFFFFVNI
jgi:hypothetical protein